MKKALLSVLSFIIAFSVVLPNAQAFPNAEISGITDGPPFDLGFTDTATAFIVKDNGNLIVAYGQKLAVVDLGLYQLAAVQPYDISTDDNDNNDSPFMAAAYLANSDEVIVTQQNGHALIFRLSEPDQEPSDVTISDGNELGPVVINGTETTAYITNNADGSIHVLDMGTLTVTTTITVTIPPHDSFTFTKGTYASTLNSAYFSTDKGAVVVLPDGGTSTSNIDVDIANSKSLTSVAMMPDDSYIYTTNNADNELVKIISSTLAQTDIDLVHNTAPVDALAMQVTNPNATYAYVAGTDGVTVISTANDAIVDVGEGTNEPMVTTSAPKLLASSTDGYVYMSMATTSVGIISENPWITIVSVVYSSGGSSLGKGETVTITFQSNEDGTYELRVGGDVDASGQLLTDDQGSTSGTVTASTDTAVIIPYDSNSTIFDEGDNTVYVFVTDADSNLGRRGTTINVDTPPDDVTLRETGFGRERVYIVFDRLTASDMSHYNVYVDPDPAAVLTKTDVGAAVTQPDSGDTVTGEVSGLTNGTTYYIAVEGVDAAGNVSVNRSNLLVSGIPASATPQETVGPAGFAGEKGCTLVSHGQASILPFILWLLPLLFLLILMRRRNGWSACHSEGGTTEESLALNTQRRGILRFAQDDKQGKGSLGFARDDRRWICTVLIIILLFASTAIPRTAEAFTEKKSPQWWSFELKAGFWLPTNTTTKRFFDTCCNVVTRMEGGLLIHGRYGIEQTAGIMWKSGNAIGVQTGQPSMDSFSFILIPLATSFAWRLDYWDWRYIIPYFKAGIDYWLFRENVKGDTTWGIKYGTHGVAGIQLPLSEYSDDVAALDKDYGLNDISFTMEGQYQWINNFGGGGLNLSGWLFSAGFLFTF